MTEEYKITIVGCGPGTAGYLTEAGRRAIADASVLAGASGLLDNFASPDHERICFGGQDGLNMDGLLSAVSERVGKARIAILVSGDPGLGSLARPVLKRFGKDACEVIPGISSVQLAFARLGLDWTDARIISAHREIPDISASDLLPFGIVAILGGHRRAQAWIADLAGAFGDGRVLVVCQDLSLPGESIQKIQVPEFRFLSLSTRTIVLIVREEVLV